MESFVHEAALGGALETGEQKLAGLKLESVDKYLPLGRTQKEEEEGGGPLACPTGPTSLLSSLLLLSNLACGSSCRIGLQLDCAQFQLGEPLPLVGRLVLIT